MVEYADEYDDEDEDEEESEGMGEAPATVIAWLEEIIRQEIRAFLQWLWEEGDLGAVIADAIREGAVEAIEDVAMRQPWRQMLGGEWRQPPSK